MGIVYKVWKGPYALGQTKQITCLLKKYLHPTVELLGQLSHVCAGLQVTKWPISTLRNQLYFQSLISLETALPLRPIHHAHTSPFYRMLQTRADPSGIQLILYLTLPDSRDHLSNLSSAHGTLVK